MNTKRVTAFVLCVALQAQCAGIRAAQSGPARQPAPRDPSATAMLAAAQHIPIGSRVKITLTDGHALKAVLLAVEGEEIVVRERTRIPEPPVRVAADRIAAIELDSPHIGVGKMVAIGAAIGTGVTLAFLAILAASLDD